MRSRVTIHVTLQCPDTATEAFMPFSRIARTLSMALALTMVPALALCQQSTTAQAPPRDTPHTKPATLTGTVVNQDTTAPIRRARVTLRSSTGNLRRQQVTDLQGRFFFGELPRGDYIVHVSKAGYLAAEYGQRAPGPDYAGTPIAVASSNIKLVMPMRRGGVLGGTVTDDVGEPEHGVGVRALRLVVRNGRQTLENAGTAMTDDLGGFRIAALPPGAFVLVVDFPKDVEGDKVAGDAARAEAAYAPAYFPSAGSAPIPLAIGEQRGDLNVQVMRRLTARVTGTVTNIAPTAVATVDLVAADTWPIEPMLSVGLDANGGFAFDGVAPGTYSVVVKSGPTTRIKFEDGRPTTMMIINGRPGLTKPDIDVERRWAATTISVQESDVTGVTLTLQRGVRIAGQATFDLHQRPTGPNTVRVLLVSMDAPDRNYAALGEVNAEGRFAIPDVMPGAYRVSIFSDSNWWLRSARIGGVDVLDEPLDVRSSQDIDDGALTITDRPSQVVGTVRAPNGAPVTECTVVVFAEDARSWTPQSRRIVTKRPSSDGRFTVPGLPAGAYYITAVTDWDLKNVHDPALLRLLTAAAQVVHVRDAETVTASLTIER
jgi:hypothetical protein